jgi:hypothetical protein
VRALVGGVFDALEAGPEFEVEVEGLDRTVENVARGGEGAETLQTLPVLALINSR